MQKSESIAKIASALIKAQKEIGNPVKSQSASNGNKKMYDYANITGYIEEAKPKLAQNGLTIMQNTKSKDGLVGIETILIHESGEFIGDELYIDNATKSLYNGNALQNMGSILTYLRRYALSSMLFMGADDNDGQIQNLGQKQQQNNKISNQTQSQISQPAPSNNNKLNELKKSVANALGARGVELNDHIKSSLSELNMYQLETVVKTCKDGGNPLDYIDKCKKGGK